MKKVLILSSSPRIHGNSDTLCDEFLKGAQKAGHEVEKINLTQKIIKPCLGCLVCSKTKKCVQNDDMEMILTKMINADVIVMATPVYFYAVSGQMKTMIDRTAPRYTYMKNKEFYYIVTAADNSVSMMNRAVEDFRGFLDCLDDPLEKGILFGLGVTEIHDILNNDSMKEAFSMGENC